MKSLFAFAFLVLTLFTKSALASEPTPEPTCTPRTVVTYSPGENWKDLERNFGGHYNFVVAQMLSGAMLSGGPFKTGESIIGGMMIFSSSDATEVEKLVQQDPFVAHSVVLYSLKNWLSCSLPQ